MTKKTSIRPLAGARKVCGCARRTWAKCGHSWHFNFKPKGGLSYRFSVDSEVGKHIGAKGDAETLADGWRSQIRAGTFRRRADTAMTAPAAQVSDVLTLATFGETWSTRRGKPASAGERSYMARLRAFTPEGAERTLGDTALPAITEDAVELFFAHLRTVGRAASTRNKYVQLVKAMFRWATKKGYLTEPRRGFGEHQAREARQAQSPTGTGHAERQGRDRARR